MWQGSAYLDESKFCHLFLELFATSLISQAPCCKLRPYHPPTCAPSDCLPSHPLITCPLTHKSSCWFQLMNHSLLIVLEVHHCSLFQIKLTILVTGYTHRILRHICCWWLTCTFLQATAAGNSCVMRWTVATWSMGLALQVQCFGGAFRCTSRSVLTALSHWFMCSDSALTVLWQWASVCSDSALTVGFCVLWSCARSVLTLVSVVVFRHGQKWASFTTAICSRHAPDLLRWSTASVCVLLLFPYTLCLILSFSSYLLSLILPPSLLTDASRNFVQHQSCKTLIQQFPLFITAHLMFETCIKHSSRRLTLDYALRTIIH